jgi:trimeric autotransporter adhesin
MMKVAIALLACCCACAETRPGYRVDTIAGCIPDQEGIPASDALFFGPGAIAVGAGGAVYTSDAHDGIRRIGADGLIFKVTPGVSLTRSIAADGAGSLYSVMGPELYVHTPAGETRTFRPLSRLPVLGSANLTAVAVGPDGTPLVADSANRIVARVGNDGSAQPIAGIGSPVALNIVPNRLAIDRNRNVYISTRSQIFRLTNDRVLSLIAGTGEFGQPVIGSPASASPFTQTGAIACGHAGEIYVVDAGTRAVLAINSEGVIDKVLWEGNAADIAVDAGGALLVFDAAGIVVRVENDGTKTFVAGRLPFAGDDGPATEALLNSPGATVPDVNGGFFIADTGNNRIRRVSSEGTITTVAGTGVYGFSGDGGSGVEAQIAGPGMLASDAEGNLYFAGQSNLRVRKLRPDGIVETVAGTGNAGNSGDGAPAVDATFRSIDGLATDKLGRLYISDGVSGTVRVVTGGVISRYAGTDVRGAGADDIPAVDSPLARPTLLSVDASGDLVIFESGARRLRKVHAKSGEITTITTTVPLGNPADASALNLCAFSSVSGMASDAEGNLFIAGSSRVCRYGKDGISSLVAGSLHSGFAGDGASAPDALFSFQPALAADQSGSLLVADTGNHRIRKLTPVADE